MSENRIADKRLAVIQLAGEIGLQKAAEIYKCSTRTILRWKKRYQTDGSAGLSNRAKSGINQPSRLPDSVIGQIVSLKTANPQMTALQIRDRLTGVKPSVSAVYKKLQQAGFGAVKKRRHLFSAEPVDENRDGLKSRIEILAANFALIKADSDLRLVAETGFKLCDLYQQEGSSNQQLPDLLDYLKQRAEKAGNSDLLYEIWRRLGAFWENQKDFDRAIACYHEQLNNSVKSRHCMERGASALFNLGFCFAVQNRQQEAIDFFLQARDKAIAAKKTDLSAKIYNNLGICYQELNNLHKAQENFRQAYQLSADPGDRKLFLTNLAMAYQASGKITDLEKFLKDELVYFRKRKDLSGELMALTTLQMHSFESGNYELALNSFRETIELAQRLNRPEVIARSCHYISQFYLESGNMEQSFNYINRAVVLALKYDSVEDIIEFKVFAVLLRYLRKEYAQALKESREIYQLIERCRDSHDSQALLNVVVLFADLQQIISETPEDSSGIGRMLNMILSFNLHHHSVPIDLLIGFLLSEILFEQQTRQIIPAEINLANENVVLRPEIYIVSELERISQYLENNQHSFFTFLQKQLQKFCLELKIR